MYFFKNVFWPINMPINVCRCTLGYNEHEIDTSMFVQKPFSRTNYIGSKIEEDIDLKNNFRFKDLPNPFSIREAASKTYAENNI